MPAENIFIVERGSVSLTSVDRQGRPRIARFIRASGIFGLDALLPERTRIFTAILERLPRFA